MLTTPSRIVLADVMSVQNASTGDREKRVVRARVLAANIELIGIATAQVGQVQGFRLDYSIEVNRIMYRGEKYIYFNEELYEVKTMSKAKLPVNMLLNVQRSKDGDIKRAVEEWIRENLQEG